MQPRPLPEVFTIYFEQVKCLGTVWKIGQGLKIQMLNNLCAFCEVFSAKCSIGIFRSSAIKEAITGMWAGLFGFPLKGTGARKGESVSSSNLSKGSQRTTSLRSSAFLKVTIPLIPRYHPISRRVLAILSELVKL